MDLWENRRLSRYGDAIASIAFLNWKQLLGDDTALVDLAYQDFGNSTNVIDHAKLSFLSDCTVPQMEMVMNENTNAQAYPSPDDPLYGSDFVTIMGIASKCICHDFDFSNSICWMISLAVVVLGT